MNALERGFQTVFDPYLFWLLRRSFRGVWIAREAAFPGGGFIAVPNHTSWWDGFVPYAVQRHLAAQPFALLMDDAQLRRFPFFRWGGAIGIDAAHRRAAYASLERAAALARTGTGVWMFPQGTIGAPRAPLHFARGYLHAARRAGVPVVPVALRFAMVEAQRPDAFVEIGEPVDAYDAHAAVRVPHTVGALVSSIDREIAEGTVFERRRSLFERSAGIDDIVARVFAPADRL